MPQFRKKPVAIEALRFDGNNFFECAKFLGYGDLTGNMDVHASDHPAIHTLEGTMTASPGDWIIRGIKGEFYPCKPDIFAATYDPIDA